MTRCPECGHDNPPEQGDFCASCRAYLRPEPTGFLRAVAAPSKPEAEPAPEAGPAPEREPPSAPRSAIPPTLIQPRVGVPAGPDVAALVLRPPGGEAVKEGALRVEVEPGERTRVLALVRNQSRIVDHYTVRVEGLPEDWWSVTPATVQLVPFRVGGAYEQEVEIHLFPPRTPEAVARDWELRIVAASAARKADAADAPLVLGIQPYAELSTEVHPQRVKGRRRATFEVTVHNKGNAEALVALEGADPDAELSFGFNRPPQQVALGGDATIGMRVRPARQLWIGRRTERPFEVTTLAGADAAERLVAAPAHSSGAGAEAVRRGRKAFQPQVRPPGASVGPGGVRLRGPQLRMPKPKVPVVRLELPATPPGGGAAPGAPLRPSQAVFVQKPWVGRWIVPVVLLLGLVAAALLLLMPREVTVPDVRGERSPFEAQVKLVDAHLKLGNVEQTITDDQPPGTILAHTPEAGTKAPRNSAVAVNVAVATDEVKAPDVTGMDLERADATLRELDLTLQPSRPDFEAKIEKQLPAAGTQVKRGTPVQVFFPGEKPPGQSPDPKTGVTKAGPVPAIAAGASVAAATKALEAAGITPTPVKAISSAEAGTVAGTDPPAGTRVEPGDEVKLIVSAGSPFVAFGDGTNIFITDAAGGQPRLFTRGGREQRFPTWSPDGTRLAYTAGGQVIIKEASGSGEARPLTPPGEVFGNLAWAPSAETDVLALTRGEPGERRLCFVRVQEDPATPACRPDEGLDIGRAMHWFPDGRTLLAFGRSEDGNEKGIVRWRTQTPFSADPDDWRKGRLVTDTSSPDRFVADAALSPDGKTLALVANPSSDFFQVYLTAPDDFLMNADPRPLGVRGCKLTWRSDSKELAVVEADERCEQDIGSISAVPLEDPTAPTRLTAAGDDPSYQPIDLEG